MRAVKILNVHTNRFAGALPDEGLRELTKLVVLSVGNNCIQGHIMICDGPDMLTLLSIRFDYTGVRQALLL
eukprot:1039038-Amphidinium_carterae.2